MDFARVVQIFKTNSLYFAHPNSWDDPYEVGLRHGKVHAIFVQCQRSSASYCHRLAISDHHAPRAAVDR